MLSSWSERRSMSSVMPHPCIERCCSTSSTIMSSVPLMTSPPRSSDIGLASFRFAQGRLIPFGLSRKPVRSGEPRGNQRPVQPINRDAVIRVDLSGGPAARQLEPDRRLARACRRFSPVFLLLAKYDSPSGLEVAKAILDCRDIQDALIHGVCREVLSLVSEIGVPRSGAAERPRARGEGGEAKLGPVRLTLLWR